MAHPTIFDKTTQKSQRWIEEIKTEINTADDNKAYLALRTVLHSLRNHLQINEAIHLGAELPMLIRGLYFEGWDPNEKPLKEKTKSEYLKYFRKYFFNLSDDQIEKMLVGVFKVLDKKISSGEMNDVRNNLPKHVRSIWIH